ncbi:condensation domain-containing protein [Pedobacter sp. NJ-S-72]
MIYTSGSTGKPKGVQNTHAGLSNLVSWHLECFQLNSESKMTATAGIGFDVFGWEIWPALNVGAALYMISDEQRLSPSDLVTYYFEEGITHSFLSTVLIPEFVAASRNRSLALQYLLAAGDKLAVINLDGLGYQVVNAYGPTENSVITTSYVLSAADGETSPPIGIPVSNTELYIVNAENKLCPVGVAGELCISGIGVSTGYLNRQSLTKEKFTVNPFSKNWGARMYRSGDLARWLPDGNIEFLGRIDDQVKIRGYRIELGEIANVLQQNTAVKQAVVLVKTDGGGHKQLVGYIVPEHVFEKESIISYLKDRLPDYMVPALWVSLEKLPLNSNGKVDRKKLPEPDLNSMRSLDLIAPRNATEQILAEIWQDLLRVEQIGIHDNFFELGGDSIITIQAVSRAKRAGLEFQPKDLFVHQTIARLAALLQVAKVQLIKGEEGTLCGNSGMLPIQAWFFEDGATVTSHFNQQILLNIDKNTDTILLADAIKQLVQYHDALRFVYQQTANGWEQRYGDYAGELKITDLTQTPADLLADAITTESNLAQHSLNIEEGILIRAVLMQTPANESYNRLLVVVHHLAVDGVSWRVFLEDLTLLLQSPQQELTAAKSHSYRQWHESLVAYSTSRSLLAQEAYWKTAAQQYIPLRTEKNDTGGISAADTASHVVTLDAKQTQRLLQEVPKAYHTEINDILLSALALTLSEWNAQGKVSIGLEGHGREDIDADSDTVRTIGWFTTLYPVLLEVGTTRESAHVIKNIKEQLRRIPVKGIGYGVLKYINKSPFLQSKDPWDVVFNYLGQWDNAAGGNGHLSAAQEDTGASAGDDFIFRDKLAINSSVRNGELVIDLGYSAKHFTAAGIQQMGESYLSHLQTLIDHCAAQITAVYTPSDYGLGDAVTYKELDSFLDETYLQKTRRNQVERIYPLSGLQSGMLFHGLYDGEAGNYVEQLNSGLNAVDEVIFSKSWDWVMQKHTILRSAFYANTFNIPVQCVYKEVAMPLTVFDYRHMDASAQETAIKEYAAADRLGGFDFTTAPLMRVCLSKLDDNRTHLLWTFHHILLDGWSMPILLQELLEVYEALATGQATPALTEDRYEDYIRYIQQHDNGKAEAHWKKYLQHITEGSLLPFVSTTADRTKGIGGSSLKQLVVNAETTSSLLAAYVQRNHITLNTLMQGVWAYLLSQYTGRNEVAYGVTVSGRPEGLPGIEHAVGMYINTLLLTATVTESPLADWLQSIQLDQLDNREYQFTPLNEVKRWAGAEGELFDTLLVFENYPVSEVLTARTWKLQLDDAEITSQTNYPLWLVIMTGAEITIRFEYNTGLLNEKKTGKYDCWSFRSGLIATGESGCCYTRRSCFTNG